MKASTLRRVLNWWPPFLFAGVRVLRLDDDYRHARVRLMHPEPSSPDMVFTANAGIVAGNRAVPSRFSPLQRQPEERWFTEWFASAGFSVHSLDQVGGFEGAGDCLADTLLPIFWAGHGTRSRVEFHARLQSLKALLSR